MSDTPQTPLQRALGDELTVLLDRQQGLFEDLIAVDAEIYYALVNRLQGQAAAVLAGPYERLITRLQALETELVAQRGELSALRAREASAQ